MGVLYIYIGNYRFLFVNILDYQLYCILSFWNNAPTEDSTSFKSRISCSPIAAFLMIFLGAVLLISLLGNGRHLRNGKTSKIF